MSGRLTAARITVARTLQPFYDEVASRSWDQTSSGRPFRYLSLYDQERKRYLEAPDLASLVAVREIYFLTLLFNRLRALWTTSADLTRRMCQLAQGELLTQVRQWIEEHEEDPFHADKLGCFLQAVQIAYGGSGRFGHLLRPCLLVQTLIKDPNLIDLWDEEKELEPHRFLVNYDKRQTRSLLLEADTSLADAILDAFTEEERATISRIRGSISIGVPDGSKSRGSQVRIGGFKLQGNALAYWTPEANEDELKALTAWAKPWIFRTGNHVMRLLAMHRRQVGPRTHDKSVFRISPTRYMIVQRLLDNHARNQFLVPWINEGVLVGASAFATSRGFRAERDGNTLYLYDRSRARTEFRRDSRAFDTTSDVPYFLALLDGWIVAAQSLVNSLTQAS